MTVGSTSAWCGVGNVALLHRREPRESVDSGEAAAQRMGGSGVRHQTPNSAKVRGHFRVETAILASLVHLECWLHVGGWGGAVTPA